VLTTTQLSGGDIRVLNITHRSKGSNVLHPTSSFTAAVQDVANGLADMSIGPFWVTAERMKMSAFTLPLGYDRTFLVIPKPGSVNFLSVFSPFSWGLWILILGIITTVSILSNLSHYAVESATALQQIIFESKSLA